MKPIKELLFLIDWETEIVDPNINKLKKDMKLFGNVTEKAVMQWVIISKELEPMYKKSRSINRRSNILRILHYFFGKFIYYHEIFYGRNPFDSTHVPYSLSSLNVKNIEKSGLTLEMIIEVGESIYKNYKDNQK